MALRADLPARLVSGPCQRIGGPPIASGLRPSRGRALGLTAPRPGQVLHIEGPMDGGGTRVVDVWESQEVFDAFIRDRLQPAFSKAGVTMPADSRPTAVWPVTAVLK